MTEKTESHVHLPVDDAADASRVSTSQTVGGSGAVSTVQEALLKPIARLRIQMDTHDMGQSLAPNPPFKSHRIWAVDEAESLPLGTYELFTQAAINEFQTRAYAEGRADAIDDLETRGILADCQCCGGAGEREVMVTDEGPDSRSEIMTCPECDGTGYARGVQKSSPNAANAPEKAETPRNLDVTQETFERYGLEEGLHGGWRRYDLGGFRLAASSIAAATLARHEAAIRERMNAYLRTKAPGWYEVVHECEQCIAAIRTASGATPAQSGMPVDRIAMLWNSLPLETDAQSVVAFVRAVENFHGIHA